MQGLTKFHQDVVGHVHDVGDGTHTDGVQTVTDRRRRGGNVHAFQQTQAICLAQLRIGDFDSKVAGPVGALLIDVYCRQRQRQIEGQRCFTGKAKHGQAVRPVGRDADFKNVAIEIQGVHQFFAGAERVGQHENAVVLFAQPQFTFRADHPVRRFAAQLGRLDLHAVGHGRAHQRHGHGLTGGHVGCAADNGQHFTGAGIHRADVEMIGLRMGLARQHFADNDVLDPFIGVQQIFHFQAEQRQLGAKFFSRAFKGDELPQPLQAE